MARQIRLGRLNNQAQIKVWSLDDSTGQVNSHIVEVSPQKKVLLDNGWTIVYDNFIHQNYLKLEQKNCRKKQVV
ncbi:hypothetical protein [Acinetobacter ursingii]|uniref:hypothetical protein n=1 Tax=Acinetobacter ursingii TaxID=108980 RepID=UPI0021E2D5A6|nr:hypothetical protein [Acinetobacter ursingii]UYF81099.1 hypothetical protein LSO59_18720 [Acinetobacter ursingii]